jgi:hypothetical protein
MNQPQPVIDTSSLASRDDNLPLALVAGVVAAAVGAALWAVITVTTGWQIGWMAVGVGFLVGFAVRKLGNGKTLVFGILGAVLALAGCLAGNLLSVVGFIAHESASQFFAALSTLTLDDAVSLMIETASPIDLFFYAFAVYEGFRLSIVPAAEPQPPAAT